MDFKLHLSSKDWNNNNSTFWQRGSCQLKLDNITKASTIEALSAVLADENGFYALIWQKDHLLCAAVDHIRSMPLFYGQKDDRLYVSDEAEWVRLQVGNTEMEVLAKEEFQRAGYVTGQDTLYPDVKQLQAGEVLIFNKNTGALNLKRYFRFLHEEPKSFDIQELSKQLHNVLTSSMQRLVDFAGGRQIVLPLSGGYDSRLIASFLKNSGYKNILTFSYGVEGNKEAEYSRKVADTLGLKWSFVEYSSKLWEDAWASSEADYYKSFAGNHVSLPHVQDWLAVKTLLERGVIDKDAVVVPGHSGDFVAGSHIPSFVFEEMDFEENELLNTILERHFSNAPENDTLININQSLKDKIRSCIDLRFKGGRESFANLYELWDCQERQAKYIVNSVRVYDHFELCWWLPLWDLDFVRFWQDVPLKLRKDRAFFKEWILKYYQDSIDHEYVNKELGNAADKSFIIRFLKVMAKKLPSGLYWRLKRVWTKNNTNNHFLGFEGLVPKDDLNNLIRDGYNLKGMYSKLYLEKRW